MRKPPSGLATVPPPSSAPFLFVGGGEMGRLVREKDWSQTPLGPLETWPQSLLTTVNLCLASNFPISLAWGPRHTQIYNDGYWPICRDKHPHSLGQDFSECWASAFPVIGEAFRSALAGKAAFLEDQRMFLDRLGYLEETFFTFSFSPIRDETGEVVGLFHPVTDVTSRMLAERRTRVLRNVAVLRASSLDAALHLAADTLRDAELDVPFVLFYRLDPAGQTARLVSQSGLPPDGAASPVVVDLTQDEAPWPLARVAATNTALRVDDLRERHPGLRCGPYPEPLASALIQPLTLPGHARPACIMVSGVSARLPMNDAYAYFYEQLAAAVASVVASAIASELEHQRAAAMAEIDRAKTEFFSNISHEFRTPLTLMLGPLEDELAETEVSSVPARRQRLDIAHRNARRLLKLVDTLLEFSRVEAGRTEASYQPTDLAVLTAELASTFRSAVETGGLTLTVDCPPLPEPVHVDREMWERIVLNLLSNAFKHTFEGGIRVTLRWCGDHVELDVTDTGVGIAAAELPLLFDRFHRVRGARSRTHEGTGIGLALIEALVHLHGGTAYVTSQEGRGSTFTVTVRTGQAHLPADQIVAASAPLAVRSDAAPFFEQALPRSSAAPPTAVTSPTGDGRSPGKRARVVWAEDNADMRDYVSRLLAQEYDVTAVADGAAAVAAVRESLPDLVLADVMMPGLDGLGVLRELRADSHTRDIPVILLSARAGEESTIGGLEAGANDYLVKPFSANELQARVRTHVEAGRLRRDAAVEMERQVRERTAELERTEAAARQFLTVAEDSRRALLGILEDEQEVESALRESEERLRLALDAAHMGTFDWDMTVNRLTWSRWHEELWGYKPGEFGGTYEEFAARVHPEDLPSINDEVARCVAKRARFNHEFRVVWPDGSVHWIAGIGELVFEATGQPARMRGMVMESTERRRAEARIRNLNRTYAVLSEVNQLIVRERDSQQVLESACRIATARGGFLLAWIGLLSGPKGRLTVTAHDGATSDTLRSIADILDNPLTGCAFTAHALATGRHAVCDDIANDAVAAPWRDAALLRGYRSMVSLPLTVEGQPVGTFNLYASEPASFDEAELRLLDGLAQDIGFALEVGRREERRRQAEAELRWKTAFLEAQVDSAMDGMVVVDSRGRTILQNQRMIELWDIPAEIARDTEASMPLQFIAQRTKHPEQFLEKVAHLNAHPDEISRDTFDLVGGAILDGASSPVRDKAGTYYGRIWVFRDITQQRQLEEQLRQSQKMEAIGQLAGGVAHDFNNMLMVIMLQAQITEAEEGIPDVARKAFEGVVSVAERAANLTRQLLLFSRKQVMQSRDLNLNEVVTSLTSMLQRIIGEDVHLQLNLHPRPLMTRADAGMLDQVLMNLVVNARDAMSNGGQLSITTTVKLVSETEAAASPGLTPGRHVCLQVTDTGSGIAPEHLGRVFEPFFTTKPSGKGTGLGLATVFGIVKQHGGAIRIESELGRGTTFHVYLLPVEDSDGPSAQPEAPAPRGGAETILLVEDERAVRMLTRVLLERNGYHVLEASDGVEAIGVWEQHADSIDLLLTDLVLPEGISGRELAAQLRQSRPRLRVIYTSGYSAEITGHDFHLEPGRNFIQKPSSAAGILETVRRCLDDG